MSRIEAVESFSPKDPHGTPLRKALYRFQDSICALTLSRAPKGGQGLLVRIKSSGVIGNLFWTDAIRGRVGLRADNEQYYDVRGRDIVKINYVA